MCNSRRRLKFCSGVDDLLAVLQGAVTVHNSECLKSITSRCSRGFSVRDMPQLGRRRRSLALSAPVLFSRGGDVRGCLGGQHMRCARLELVSRSLHL